MRYLLDANVVGEPRKPKPDSKVLSWLLRNEAASALSVLTLGELMRGARLLPPGRKRRAFESWIDELERGFAGRFLPLGAGEIRVWARIFVEAEGRGNKLPQFDSLLAATALAHNLTLVTRNTD